MRTGIQQCLRRVLAALITLSSISLALPAQETHWRDTLQAAVKTDTRRVDVSLGRMATGQEALRNVVSPMGEGDPIRWAQGLPGVTTGADGTTSMYVRGGGSGNNLFSLDGVPVYGYSHILGLTTIVPTPAIESAGLTKGGFDGPDCNFTAAHLRIITKTPSSKWRTSVALNNFLASADMEGPIGKRFSYQLSARISPLSWEYKAVRGVLPSLLGGMENFTAKVGDVYGKVHFQIDPGQYLYASFLGSLDNYGFDTPDASHEVMGWHNLIGLLKYRRERGRTDMEITLSANGYGSKQQQDKLFRGQENHLSLRSTLEEYCLQGGFYHRLWNGRFLLSEGVNFRLARFEPGQIGESGRPERTLLATVWLQGEYRIPERLSVRLAVRGNRYQNYDVAVWDNRTRVYGTTGVRYDPELSFSAKWNFTPHLALEATADRTIQYYHSLEGLPVGWSLDMIVPTGEMIPQESAWQGNAGVSGSFGAHSFSLGGFYKRMENLIYYKYSQALFSGVLARWEQHVELGNGRSYGLEALYEFQQKDWYARVSYTLSKTTREDFPSFYEGRPFHARFDRAHVLNATAQWRGLSATFILQSGHWENGAPETFEMPLLGDESWTAEYFSGVNNYQMPTVIRLDLGYQFSFKTGPLEHMVNLGVCNVTNHFNPFMLYYDTSTESWKDIALLPILPNFSWRVSF